MDSKTKAFIYLRKSQEREDRQVLSIDSQRQALRELIKRENISPIWLPKEEQSASKIGRPIFEDMIRRIYKGDARHIVTWNANRLSRNSKDAGEIIYAFDQNALISIKTPNRTYRNTKEDKFMLSIEFGTSKLYSDEISANVLRGYQAKYERGEYPTHAPTGYLNATIGYHRNIIPDPERAPKVQELFKLAASGKYTLDELHKHCIQILKLTSRNNNPLPKQTLAELLKKPVYYGVYQHGKDWHKGRYERLISQDLFDQVQIAMGWRTKKPRNSTRGAFHPYKVLSCGNCGHNLTAYIKSKKLANEEIAHYTYYVCTRKSKNLKCREPQIKQVELEEQLKAVIKPVQLSAQDAQECIKLLRHFHEEMTENRAVRLSEWRKDQKETEKKIAHLLNMRMDKELTRKEFMAYKKELSDRLVRTKELIDDAHSNADQWLELAEQFFSGAVNIVDSFKIANEEEKRKILLELGSNWEMNNKKVRFTPRKPYDLLVNRTEKMSWRG
jgi:site-specific DNA recombinase